jgi:two-component sensor histidine kinase
LRQATTLEAFKDVFLGRIHALTAAYTLLSRNAWSPVLLREILMQELQPFLSGDRVKLTMTGPAVLVVPRVALAMGMAVHELTTNALKFGAFSVPEGMVDIAWSVTENPDDRQLVLRWIERNGPAVVKPARRGFGMTLVEHAFGHDVEGAAEIDFRPEGVIATMRVPLSDKV